MADSQQPQERVRDIGFDSAEACSKLLDSACREEWQQADDIVNALAVRDDLKVVELGAGTGYFTTRLAKALPNGKILALDTEQSMVDWITNLASKQGLENISAKVVSTDDPKLEEIPFTFDVLLVGYTYHHMGTEDERVEYFQDKVKPYLPDGAVVVIVDFEDFPANSPFEHHDEQHDDHEHSHVELVKPEQVKAEFARAGFTLVTDYQVIVKPNYMLSFKATQ